MTRGARFAGVPASSRYTGAVTEALTVDPYTQEHLPCVMPGCTWVLDVPPVQSDPQRETVRRAEIERACVGHVASHPIAQWVRVLADALAEIDRLLAEITRLREAGQRG